MRWNTLTNVLEFRTFLTVNLLRSVPEDRFSFLKQSAAVVKIGLGWSRFVKQIDLAMGHGPLPGRSYIPDLLLDISQRIHRAFSPESGFSLLEVSQIIMGVAGVRLPRF